MNIFEWGTTVNMPTLLDCKVAQYFNIRKLLRGNWSSRKTCAIHLNSTKISTKKGKSSNFKHMMRWFRLSKTFFTLFQSFVKNIPLLIVSSSSYKPDNWESCPNIHAMLVCTTERQHHFTYSQPPSRQGFGPRPANSLLAQSERLSSLLLYTLVLYYFIH